MAEFHVAIIMDGNGRWATRRGLPRVAGHRSGASAVRRTIEAAPDLGISILTLYAFSEDNWNRPPREVSALMKLLGRYLIQETDRCIANGVRLEAIGRRDRLPRPLVNLPRRVRAQDGIWGAFAAAARDRLLRAPSDCGGRPPRFP
jgi:undecaprenyl diphosphate synthase